MRHKTFRRSLAFLVTLCLLVGLVPVTGALAAPGDGGGGEIIYVTDYGADPTGATESSSAIRAAMAYAGTLPEDVQKTVVFPKGEYHFYEEYSESRLLYVSNTLKQSEPSKYRTKYIGILVEGMKNVTVEGSGSQFIFHGNICTLAAIDSENVKFQNFDMDHASPTVVDVTVESYVDEKAAIIYVPSCYTYRISGTTITWEGERGPVSGQPYWSGTNNLGYQQGFNTITGQTTRSPGNLPFSNVSSIEQVEGDPTRLKVTYSSAGNRPTLGMCFQMRNANPRMTPGTFFWQSDGVTLNNINVQYLHGFGMVGQLSKNITLDTVKFETRPGTGRTSAGFADFVQMSSVGGQVTIRNCEFSNPHDDPINIHGTFLRLTGVDRDTKTVTVAYQHDETWGFPQYYVGDTVDFSSQGSMAPLANSECEVKAVVNPGEGGNDLTTIKVTLDRIPDGITADNASQFVMENATYTPDVLIEGCRFVETPTRGILVTTRGEVVIQNNYLDRMGMAAIYISCDAKGWYESGRTQNVTIRENTFVVNPHTSHQAAIFVDPTGLGQAGNRIHKNLVIEDNVFNMDNVTNNINVNVVNARGVDGLTIRGNTIQRSQPNVSLGLSAGSTALAVGGSQELSLTTGGTTYTAPVFRLEQCEDITIENNFYDDGMNLGVDLSDTSADQVTVIGDDLTVGGGKQTPAVVADGVRYFSSDPAVAAVDQNGVVTGVGPGTAEIYAYRTAGKRTFESNHLTFTVTGEAVQPPSSIVIAVQGGGAAAVDVGGTLDLAATVTGGGTGTVTWAAAGATDGASATIDQSGVLTGVKPGVVEVTATQGGVTASKLVTVGPPSEVYLSDLDWASASAGDSTWNSGQPKKDGAWEGHAMSLRNADGTEAVFSKGIGTHAVSTIVYDLAGWGYTDFSSNFGISYYKSAHNDAPNLKFIVEGDGRELFSKDATVNEAYKETGMVDISGVGTLTLKVNSNKSDTYSAHANWADAKLYSTNQPPTASDVTAAAGSGVVNVGYTFADADAGDTKAEPLIAWYVADANGHFTPIQGAKGATLRVTAALSGKTVKAAVTPLDSKGRYGAPVESNAVTAPAATEVRNDATLAELSLTGLALSPAFSPDVTRYTVDVPAAVSAVTVNAAASQEHATVSGTGNVALDAAGKTVTVTVTAPDGSTTKTYTVDVRRARSSDATLKALSASAGSASVRNFAPGTRFYDLTAALGDKNLVFSATPADGAKVEVRYNTVEKGEYAGEMTLPLETGLNHLELRVTAADGVTTALYRVRVLKPAASDNANLTAFTVNGQNVLTDTPEVLRLDGDTVTVTAAAEDSAATLLVSVGGELLELADGAATATVTRAVTLVAVRVVAEDGVTETSRALNVIKKDAADARLYDLKVDGLKLDQPFDPEVTEYEATLYGASGKLRAFADQADATLDYEAASIYGAATGALEIDCPVFKDEGVENVITVTVTSPNGNNKKTYTITVTEIIGSIYLSDMDWASATTGWADHPAQKDKDIDEKKISLRGEGNEKLEFEKGIGTHANSNIVYDLTGMGFTTVSGRAGISHYMCNNDANKPNLKFRILLDDNETAAWVRDQGYQEEAPDAFSVNITGANKLTLSVTSNQTGVGGAHGNWADAKLSANVPLLENTPVAVQAMEFVGDEDQTVYIDDEPLELQLALHPYGTSLDRVRWESSNTNVATVVDGEVVGVSEGEVTITAKNVDGTVTATCDVVVKRLIQGSVAISASGGEARLGSTLTANVNDIHEAFKEEGLSYVWSVSDTEDGEGTPIPNATSSQFLVPLDKEYRDQFITVTVTPNGTYHDGEAKATTAAVLRAVGPALQATPTFENATAEDAEDGAITGLFKGRAYEWQQVENATQEVDETKWTPFSQGELGDDDMTGNFGTARIEGLGVGTYIVRRAADDLYEAGVHRTVTIAVRGTTKIPVTNPQTFAGGTVTVGRNQIPEGDTVRLQVKPDTGYELVSLKAITEEGAEIVAEAGSTQGLYTFTMPLTAGVTIAAEFALKTYTITHNIENFSCDLGDPDTHPDSHTATHGKPFSITFTPDEGYELPVSLSRDSNAVTETKTGKRFTDYTYLPDVDDHEARVMTFTNGVPCDITVTGAATLKEYTVVYDLTSGLTAPNAAQTAAHGKKFSVTLAAAKGYALPETVSVTVDGQALTLGDGFEYQDGKVTVKEGEITGNVVITAAGAVQDLPLQTVALVGPARVGRTLTVNTVPVAAKMDYQWCYVEAGEEGTQLVPIADATEAQYVIPAGDENKVICVKVTGKDGYTGELTSEPTATILPAAAEFVYVETVTLDSAASVAVGKTVKLAAAVSPDNATSGVLFWSSSNEAIATVDQNGAVTGVAEGTATITAAATDRLNAAFATCEVTVTPAPKPSTSTSKPSTTTETKTEPDGTKVTTVTDNRTGTVTETTEKPDGTTEVVETKKDGTVTETVTDPEGAKTEKVTTPDEAVTITVTDPEGEVLATVELPAEIPEPEEPFVDVDGVTWAKEAINSVAGLGLVKGVGDKKYDPITPMTRGSLATVLHRLSQGKTDYESTFKDVAKDTYYTEGVAWAAKVKVVTGYTAEIFAPDDIITREQLAVMLARYAKLIGMDTTADKEVLDGFVDGDKTGPWAVDGVAWAVQNGILKGKGANDLDPTANVSRAEVAVMLDRFIQLIK